MSKKRNLLLFLALILALGMMLAGCAKSEPADNGETPVVEDQSLTAIQDKGVLVLGCDDAFPPMGFRDPSGTIVGFDIDLATKVAEKLGVKLEVKAINWDTKEMELNSGNIDVIWNGFTITAERNEKVEFTKPYLNNEIMLVVKAGSPIKTKADLNGKLVGYQTDSSAEIALNADQNFFTSLKEARGYDNYQNALLDMTSSDRIDAVAVDKILIEYLAAQEPDKFFIMEEALGKEYMGIGCAQGAVALREAIDNALDELFADGTVEEVSKEWFGNNIVIRDVDKLTTEQLKEMGL
ncbi:MAG TPA: amino acid ABC transporter substrate-binding protein [Clostridiales bacterium]|jgi:polar amino acid transport system substrate-binding protein|nr:amino acid ABC transporter substrate-binding protein [Clostridiales bacterium]